MLAEFNMAPLGVSGSLVPFVAEVVEIIKNSGLSYHLNAMGTIIEGDTDEVFELIKKCQKHLASKSERVYTVIKIDDKVGKTEQLKQKVERVKQKLDGEINTA